MKSNPGIERKRFTWLITDRRIPIAHCYFAGFDTFFRKPRGWGDGVCNASRVADVTYWRVADTTTKRCQACVAVLTGALKGLRVGELV